MNRGSDSLLDPVLVARLATMEMRARYVVEGALSGRHRSRRQGHSLEFVGHRPYTPSDEWRYIDWKVFAKTDRWVVREQEEESNLRAVLLMDTSRSMSYAGPNRLSKSRYTSLWLAALSYLLARQRESVGLGFFNSGLYEFIPPRSGSRQLNHILERLDGCQIEGVTNLRSALEAAGQRLPRRSLVLIASDFLSDPRELLPSLRLLTVKRHEVIGLQILDPDERDLDFQGEIQFEDLETGETLRVNVDQMAASYRTSVTQRLTTVSRAFSSLGADFYRFWTDTSLQQGLSAFLKGRRSPRTI